MFQVKKLKKQYLFKDWLTLKKFIQLIVELIQINISFSNRYICFIDSYFEHQDRIRREGKIDLYKRKKYYDYLNNLFIYLNKIFKKKIIICIHPKNDDKYFKKNLRNLKF